MKIKNQEYSNLNKNSLLFCDYNSGVWHFWSFTNRDGKASKRYMVCGVFFVGNGEQGARFYKNLHKEAEICQGCLEGSKY